MAHQFRQSQEMKNCIDTCLECFSSCLETVNHCEKEGGEHVEQRHLSLLQVCADTCQLAARSMLLDAEIHPRICEVCAEVCEQCAEDCESFDDRFMRKCAQICRQCAESCYQMAQKSFPKQRHEERRTRRSAAM